MLELICLKNEGYHHTWESAAVPVPGVVDVGVDVLAVVVFVVNVFDVVHDANEFNSTADAIIAPPPFRKSRLVTRFLLFNWGFFRSSISISYFILLNREIIN